MRGEIIMKMIPGTVTSQDDGSAAAAQGFARKLEGYDAADLRALVERAMHEALMRRLAAQPCPTGCPLARSF